MIAGLFFMGGMRRERGEWAALGRRPDVADGDGVLVTVRRGKTNQEGETRDVRSPGVEHVTAHSERLGLALELTSRGASTTDVMPSPTRLSSLELSGTSRA